MSSALIGTAGDCCVVSECQVEVRSRPSEPQWRNAEAAREFNRVLAFDRV